MKFTKVPCPVKSADGAHTLNGIIYVPIGTVKAAVMIIHGLCEHIELYDRFMTKLAENGIAAFAYDQQGHGKTAAASSELGFFAEDDGAQLLIDDAHIFAEEVFADYTGIPRLVFGHSMGTFTARLLCEEYPGTVDGLILAGTSGRQPGAALSIALTDVKSRVQGGAHRSQSAQRLFYDIYNLTFRDESKDYSWLSTLPEVIEEHENDELFNFTFSVKGMNDIVRLCTRCSTDEWYENFPKDCPVLLISGEHDPLGNFGKGVLEVYKRLKDVTSEDNVTLKLYRNARHELLHEYCTETVINDIITWIERKV